MAKCSNSTESGLVDNTKAELERNAEFYRASLASGDFLENPQSLGMLSFWTSDIGGAGWRDQRVPTTEGASGLRALLQVSRPELSRGYVLSDSDSVEMVRWAFLAAEAIAEGRPVEDLPRIRHRR